jgi:hypothetical protein
MSWNRCSGFLMVMPMYCCARGQGLRGSAGSTVIEGQAPKRGGSLGSVHRSDLWLYMLLAHEVTCSTPQSRACISWTSRKQLHHNT